MYNQNANAVITNCIFKNNTANHGGGGIFSNFSSPTITNTIFVGNTTNQGGGGVSIYSGGIAKLINCTFTNNRANRGGGINISKADDSVIVNSILWKNTATGDNGNEILDDFTTSPSIVSNCLIDGGYKGSKNIDLNPRFLNRDLEDFRLSVDSPGIDAGSITALAPDETDLDSDGNTGENIPIDLANNPRLVGDSVDMGAFEYQRD